MCAHVFAYVHVCKCVCVRTCVWVGGCTSARMIACVHVFFCVLHLGGCTGARACVLDCVHTRCHEQDMRARAHTRARPHTWAFPLEILLERFPGQSWVHLHLPATTLFHSRSHQARTITYCTSNARAHITRTHVHIRLCLVPRVGVCVALKGSTSYRA